MTAILTLLKLFFSIFRSKKSLVCEIAMLRKELQILQRKVKSKRVITTDKDRIFFTLLQMIANIKDRISIVKPETVLSWQRNLIKKYWTFNTGKKRRGRKPIAKDIQILILKIKNDNLLWGVRKIQIYITIITGGQHDGYNISTVRGKKNVRWVCQSINK